MSKNYKTQNVNAKAFKQIIMSLIFMLLIGSVYAQSATTPPGAGTAANPYLISTLNHLAWMSGNTSSGTFGTPAWWVNTSTIVHFRQTEDINASATSNWNGGAGFRPIGYSVSLHGFADGRHFLGVYDGQNHTISNLYINQSGARYARAGLFSIVSGVNANNRSVIKNLGLINVDITSVSSASSNQTTYSNAGGIAANMIYAEIENCYVTGEINAVVGSTNQNRSFKSGGLVGEVGLNANNSGFIRNSYSTAYVRGQSIGTAGNSFNYAGGIAGYIYALTIEDCYSRGTVRGIQGTSGTRELHLGGIVGQIGDYSTIRRNYATGPVYSTGTGTINRGGIGGRRDPNNSGITIERNIWNIDSTPNGTGQSQALGTGGTPANNSGYTSAEMRNGFNYTGSPHLWNFRTVWNIDNRITGGTNDRYPYLRVFSPEDRPMNLVQNPTVENISLSWIYPFFTGNVTGFRIYRRIGNGTWTQLTQTPNNNTRSYLDTSVSPGIQYEYRVTAVFTNPSGESDFSNTIIATTIEGRPSNWADANSGTAANPYLISNLQNLIWMSEASMDWFVNYYNPVHFLQTADIDASNTIDMNNGNGFRPIGHQIYPTDNPQFYGVYDGNNKKISNLYTSGFSEFSDGGLFSRASSNTTIKNLTLENIYVSGYIQAGGIVGYFYSGTIENCHVSGNIEGSGSSSRAGGIVGQLYFGTSTLQNNSFTGNISGSVSGGIAGESFIGSSSNSIIRYCFSTGDITGVSRAGGIVGQTSYGCNLSIQNCFSLGSINGTSALQSYTGGIVGLTSGSNQIDKCYSVGSISVAYNNINTGMGGIVGNLGGEASVTNSVWNTQTTGLASNQAIGAGSGTVTNSVGLNTGQMRQATSYTTRGWDFVNIWDINMYNNNGYPHLRALPKTIYVSSYDPTQPNDPSAPLFVRATITGPSSVLIEWERPLSHFPDGYVIYLNQTEIANQTVLNSFARSFTYNGTLTAGELYVFRIAAFYNYLFENKVTNSSIYQEIETESEYIHDSATLFAKVGVEFYGTGVGFEASYSEGSSWTFEQQVINAIDSSQSVLHTSGPFYSSFIEVILPIRANNQPRYLTALHPNYTSWGQVSISWQAPESQHGTVLDYRIYRDGTMLDTENENLVQFTQFSDNLNKGGLISGNVYSYYVTAVYASGESNPSHLLSHNT